MLFISVGGWFHMFQFRLHSFVNLLVFYAEKRFKDSFLKLHLFFSFWNIAIYYRNNWGLGEVREISLSWRALSDENKPERLFLGYSLSITSEFGD